jgi:hypothetical protein
VSASETVAVIWVVLAHTPFYAWLLLAVALGMGYRRLKRRRSHLFKAAITPAAFLIWGLYSAAYVNADGYMVAVIWACCFALGAASSAVRLSPRPERLEGFVFEFAPSTIPLLAYLCLFAAHYALAISSGLMPELAVQFSLARAGLSALTAGRTSVDLLHLLPRSNKLRAMWSECIPKKVIYKVRAEPSPPG